MRALALGSLALLAAAGTAGAQDTTRPREGVTVELTYRPGVRPRLVVTPAPAELDSARAIIQRDLDYSDRFELIPIGSDASVVLQRPNLPDPSGGTVNYALYRTLGATYAVEVAPAAGGVQLRLHDLNLGTVRREQTVALPPPDSPEYRMELHRAADEVVRWITGTPGIAATRLLFVMGKRVYQVDSDGHGLTPLTGERVEALSPAWAPDGRRFAYTQFGQGRGTIMIEGPGGSRIAVAGTGEGLNYAPAFSPDGRTLAFARSGPDGTTDIFAVDLAQNCCLRRLTVGRFADNLSPTFSPDGRRIAFVSTRAGLPQVYVMAADGTDQELFAPFDYGVTGSSNAPEWSPDGASLAFHRDVARAPQIFVMDVASRRVRQLTSSDRNEDPTWAPDGRHLAFVSERSGRRQIWIIDMETGRIRQIRTPGAVRLPSWSRRLGRAAADTTP
ncbi:MAG TPA: hypothetical protein VNK43_04195 [Gemmatimonadales bacterium]|nr:hypothetical protein [Gemmatimonadales bacterium]